MGHPIMIWFSFEEKHCNLVTSLIIIYKSNIATHKNVYAFERLCFYKANNIVAALKSIVTIINLPVFKNEREICQVAFRVRMSNIPIPRCLYKVKKLLSLLVFGVKSWFVWLFNINFLLVSQTAQIGN